MSSITKLRYIFDRKIKVKLAFLLIAIIIGAMLETLALSIISPFISILMDNSIIQSNKIVNFFYNLLGFQSTEGFLALLAFLLAFVYISRGIYIYWLNKVQYAFIGKRRVELSSRLMEKTMSKPYLFHANKNVAEMQKVVVDDVVQFLNLITSILQLLTDAFMTIFILVFLLVVSFQMTFVVIAMAAICLFLYFKVFRRKIRKFGQKTREKYIEMTKTVNQGLGGIKEVKVLHREKYFEDAFKKSGNEYTAAWRRYQVINSIPKLIIESVCFSGAFVLVGFYILTGANVVAIVPQLSLFVLAAFRLLPAISRIAGYVTGVIYLMPCVDAIYASLFEDAAFYSPVSENRANIKNSLDIEIHGVTFRYPNIKTPVLKNVSLTIPDKTAVAFVGSSGAGKTTLADIILGILSPQQGYISYKGKSIHQDSDAWAKRVGYIPQQIYLLDETILENIAFGIPKDEIDDEKVWKSLRQAQLEDFVMSLPDKLQTIVGDRGIRLSGGQRQRIGIARAMYEDPPVMVLDEATSSLDNDTEKAVMEAIMGLHGDKTLIIVAHRLSTIEHCDIVYRIDGKRAVKER
ncbi:MAG: ABC transporter ATP-binding protein/permease [Clostridiales Family XIII bacterium]|jgi:ABC-type multidrug transport system fused ATPase/permease subunit|nr:ABC transporter ATP-binding protein/permease [Clostridiales Family XIII bacterium]